MEKKQEDWCVEPFNEDEFIKLKQLPLNDQVDYLIHKVQAIEAIILNYSKIIEIAQFKIEEFSNEATQTIKCKYSNLRKS